MAPIGVAHLDAAVWEILGPASSYEFGGVGVAEELFRVGRLHARIDDDRKFVGEVISSDVGAGRVDVGGRFKAGEGGPEEVDRARRGTRRLVREHHQRPLSKGRVGSKARRGFRLIAEARTAE